MNKEETISTYLGNKANSKYFKEYGETKEYIQLKNGQIVKKENAKKFVDNIIEEEFVNNI